MENEPVKRTPPSGIPRLSRLPLPTTTVSKPIRPSPSRERLQADQGINVARLRRPSEDVFKAPYLPPPSARKVSENLYTRRASTQRTHPMRAVASTESLSAKRNAETRHAEIGPSLEDRTIETLAHIPASPSPSRRQSAFYRPSSPIRSPSRPASAARPHPPPQLASPLKNVPARMSLAAQTPRAATIRRSMGNLRGNTSASSARKPSGHDNREELSVSRPRYEVNSPRMPPTAETKTTTLRTSKPRQSLSQAVKHSSSVQNGINGAKAPPKPKEVRESKARNPPSAHSSHRTSPTSSISKTSRRTSVTSGSNISSTATQEHEPKKASKSSNALRESIAKAKAARKAAKQNDSRDGLAEAFESLSLKDPFNPLQMGGSNKAVLLNKTRTARKTGHLNIAALGLTEIPHEVFTMYDYDPDSNEDWYDTVDLSKFIAADNEFESLPEEAFPDVDISAMPIDEDSRGYQFGGLEVLDLHGNLLASLPIGLRRLQRLHSLNVAKNKLNMDAIEVITQIKSLTELKLGNNDLEGMLTPQLGSLQRLEVLDLRGNALTGLPDNLSDLTSLRVLNVAENQLTSLPFSALSKLPLVEINAQKNRLHGHLIPASIRQLEGLQNLNIAGNALEKLSAGDTLELPSLQQLFADSNRINSLPNISSWKSLLTLVMDDNGLSELPAGFTELSNIKHVDFKGNNINILDDKLGLMDSLMTFHIENNPLRERKFLTMDIEDIKRELRARCEHEQEVQVADEEEGSDNTEFTLAPETPETSNAWQLKSGGVLDRSSTDLCRLDVEDLEPVIANADIRCLYLQHNRIEKIPMLALTRIYHSLTDLDLSHNPMSGDEILTSRLELPQLQNLTLAAVGLTSFEPLQTFLAAPSLAFLDVSQNRLTGALPVLRSTYPNLITFLASDNQINSLSFEAVQGLQALDVSNNDIDFLPPRLGLLGIEDSGGLRRLDVAGNSFRVPKWQIVAKGTEALLDWLKNRITPEEMREWQGDVEEY